MFLRCHKRIKDGKEHRYYSVEESRRLQSGKVVQRRVLYLGEINDSQQAAWRKTLDVFDEQQQRHQPLSLFAEGRPVPADAIDGVQVKLSQMQLRRARPYGNCWLGCELWRELELDWFWERKLARGREEVSWAQVLELLVVNRLIDPGSEFRVHRQWFDQSAMDVLLGVDFAVAEKDRLYRCLDRILEHKQELFQHLQQRWKNLFDAQFDVLLYDLTSTYVEGEAEQNPKAKRGYSRDGRPDCKQVIVALVITPEGFPLAYEVMDGNRPDKTTLQEFLSKIEALYGKARRVWLMDRGVPTEAILAEMREPAREMFYLVGTPKARVSKFEKHWLDLPWRKVRDSVEVKLFGKDGELYVLAKSEGRQQKEIAIRRKKLVRLLRKLRAMRRSCPKRDQLLMRVGAAKTEAGRAFGFVNINLPKPGQQVTRESFTFQVDKVKTQGRRTARRPLLAAHQSSRRRSRRTVGSLHAAHTDRSGVQMSEERSGHSSHLSSARAPSGGAHPGSLSCLLSERHAEVSPSGTRSRFDAAGGAGKACGHSDDRHIAADHRRSLSGHAALHRAGDGPSVVRQAD